MASIFNTISCIPLTSIAGSDCIGDSRQYINKNIEIIGTIMCSLISSLNTPVKYVYTPSTPTSSFPITGINVSPNAVNYRVNISGVTQEPGVDYYISGNDLITTTPFSTGDKIVIITNPYIVI